MNSYSNNNGEGAEQFNFDKGRANTGTNDYKYLPSKYTSINDNSTFYQLSPDANKE